jgi:hypothetical protein
LVSESCSTAAIGALALTSVLAHLAPAAIPGAVAAPRAGARPLAITTLLSPLTRLAAPPILALRKAMPRMGAVGLCGIGKKHGDPAEHGQDGQLAHESSPGLALPHVARQSIKPGVVHVIVSFHA